MEQRDRSSPDTQAQRAVFAGGCFWCMEGPFRAMPGVLTVTPGYTGGTTANPSYDEVCRGVGGHYEAVEIWFDPARVRYEEMLEIFWRQIDPADSDGQFADRGPQYRTAIFYSDELQRLAAEASREALQATGRFGARIATAVLPAGPWYPAEEYHHDYARRRPEQYQRYRTGSGRADFLRRMWAGETMLAPGPAPDEELRRRLTPLQYHVTRENGTEPPFANVYWDQHQSGVYVDLLSGAPLFSSADKFDSGCGWPSFTRPLVTENIVEREDRSLLPARIEVRCRLSDAHLGHVFPDGPPPTGRRYCINSASLRFVPREHLAREGLAAYLPRCEASSIHGDTT
ncbi:MAG: methionine sulfoxide reductase [Desulfobulbaceae bacterium A2]|nr:MAG: methionine sulfoxide reductase [Desulfobulbaceae bacterium A2]